MVDMTYWRPEGMTWWLKCVGSPRAWLSLTVEPFPSSSEFHESPELALKLGSEKEGICRLECPPHTCCAFFPSCPSLASYFSTFEHWPFLRVGRMPQRPCLGPPRLFYGYKIGSHPPGSELKSETAGGMVVFLQPDPHSHPRPYLCVVQATLLNEAGCDCHFPLEKVELGPDLQETTFYSHGIEWL